MNAALSRPTDLSNEGSQKLRRRFWTSDLLFSANRSEESG